jgi:hypothetical protein
MSAYGNGSVYPRKDERWVAKVIVNGKPKTKYAKTEKEANKALRDLWVALFFVLTLLYLTSR